jgi:ABC-type nitrate/sulfonate/bicarbonate transport system substrate-binding protein
VRAFLAATAEGYRHAAAHPDQAADALVAAAAADHPDLPQPLDGGMCRDSMQLIAQVGGL